MINLIKNIFKDIFILYKNFFHFNVSKVINIFISIFYIIIFTVPLVVFINFYIDFIKSTWNTSIFYEYIYYIIQWFIFFFFIWSLLYYFTLQTKVHLDYIDWKPNTYKNNYFNLRLLFNHFKLVFVFVIIFIVLFLIFSYLFKFLIFSFWWIEAIYSLPIAFTILSGILGIIILLLFFYLTYILYISIIVLVDNSNEKKFKSIIYYIKKAFYLNKWLMKKIKILSIFLIFTTLSLIILIPFVNSLYKSTNINNFILYKTNQIEIKENNFFYFEELKLIYWNSDLESLKKDLKTLNIIKYILFLLVFLVIIWLFGMMLVSFYRRELLWKQENKKSKQIDITFNKIKEESSAEEKLEKKNIKKTTPKKKKIITKKTTTAKKPVKKEKIKPKKTDK